MIWILTELCKDLFDYTSFTGIVLGIGSQFHNVFSTYRKFPNRGAGRLGKTSWGVIIREGTFSPTSGFLQNENRTIFDWDMAKNV